MAKSSCEIEKEFIDGLKSNTGKDLNAWLKEIKSQEIEKRNDIIKWLKDEMKFGHMHASLLVGIYFSNGKPVYDNETNLLDNQFSKCHEMIPVYEKLSSFLLKIFPEAQVIAKKTYISFTSKKEFAAVNVKPLELRLGFDLGDAPFKGELEKSKLTGPMPRISHMIIIKNEKQINEDIKKFATLSFKRTN